MARPSPLQGWYPVTTPALTYHEQPFYFRSGDEDLFAILTEPPRETDRPTVLMLAGGSWLPSTERNRIYAQLARRVAAKGFPSLRLDYHGVGESTGQVDFYDLANPHVEDTVAAAQFLTSRGHERIILAGQCFGGSTAIAAASEIERLAGLALLGVAFEPHRGASKSFRWHVAQAFKRTTLARLRQPGRWRQYVRIARKAAARAAPWNRATETNGDGPSSSWSVDALIDTIDRGIPVLLLYGIEGLHYEQFLKAREGPLGEAIDRAGDLVSVVVTEGEIHGFVTLESQRLTKDHVSIWLDGLA